MWGGACHTKSSEKSSEKIKLTSKPNFTLNTQKDRKLCGLFYFYIELPTMRTYIAMSVCVCVCVCVCVSNLYRTQLDSDNVGQVSYHAMIITHLNRRCRLGEAAVHTCCTSWRWRPICCQFRPHGDGVPSRIDCLHYNRIYIESAFCTDTPTHVCYEYAMTTIHIMRIPIF